jgi:HEPN domain-containing protein
MKKSLIIILFVFLLVYCSKESSVSKKDTEEKNDKGITEVEKTEEISEVEKSKSEIASKKGNEDKNFPTRALIGVQDVLSKGEPYVSEESWEKLLKAASQVEKIYNKFGETSGTLYNEMGKKIEAMSTKDEAKINKMQEEVKKKIDAACPTKEQIEVIVKEAGFENLEEAVEIAKRAPKVDFLYKLLMSIETNLKTADLGDLSKETHLTSQQKEGMRKMAEVAKQAAKEGIEGLKKELKDKPYYTKKDIEIFLKCKERYNDALQGIIQLQGQLD